MRHTVIDIETLGTNRVSNYIAMPNLAVVYFPGLASDPSVFYASFNVTAQMLQGAESTASTIGFWMSEALKDTLPAQLIADILADKRSLEVAMYSPERSGLLVPNLSTNKEVLFELRNWYLKTVPKNTATYGNGNDFDHKILEAHLTMEQVPDFYAFWQQANLRSLKDIFISRNSKEEYIQNISKPAVDSTLAYFDRYGLEKLHTPTKHDPVYDALVEGYELLLLKQLL